MFILKSGTIDIEPKALFIPEFKTLYDRDKSKDKSMAMKEFAYVYFIADYKSEYNIYGLEKRTMISSEIMGTPNYKPDDIVNDAITRYELIQQTYSMRYLRSVRDTIDSLMKFYDELRFKSKTTNVASYDPSLVTKALKEVELILEKIEKWEKKVKGEEDMMQIRGGGKIGLFEDPEKATWLNRKK